jgi:hypothetical protein
MTSKIGFSIPHLEHYTILTHTHTNTHNRCDDLATNLEYMASKFGFFVPYLEHVEDLPALLEYAGQKVSVGNVCLWCNKAFHSLEGVQKHMVDKGHCKICLEGYEDEWQDFYGIDLIEDDEEDWETDEEEEVDEEMENAEDVDQSMRNRKGKLADAARMSKKYCRSVQELTVSSSEGTKVIFSVQQCCDFLL